MPQRTEELLHFKNPPRENGARHAWFPKAKEQLAAIAALPQGWDSNGAAPPIPTVVFGAESLLLSLCHDPALPQPHIHPTRSGGVQFEWENGTRYFEIEVQGERAATYFYSDDDTGEETSGTVFEDESLVVPMFFIHRVFPA